MLKRYGISAKGRRIRIANIYTAGEHKIDNSQIDREALKIIRRLQGGGFEAYVVGGAVRDLLLGQTPKDFDIATDAQPRQIRRLFRNSRIIGRRFQLVHIFFGDKIIEVSTFRSTEAGTKNNNVFGSLEEDARRRDFTLNALYYTPKGPCVLDYVGGFKDIQERRMRSLLPLDRTFVDDPVRLVRAVKYAGKTGFSLTLSLGRAMRKYSGEMARCPSSRLTEEIFKILQGGSSRKVFEGLILYGVFPHMLPEMSRQMEGGQGRALRSRWMESLNHLDEMVETQEDTPRHAMLAHFIEPFLFPEGIPQSPSFLDVFKAMKEKFSPLTPPNREVEATVRALFKMWGLRTSGPRKRRRHPAPPSGSGSPGGRKFSNWEADGRPLGDT